MVKLLDDYENENAKFQKCGIKVPQYNQDEITKAGIKNPQWVHFGGGNLFRSYHALIAQNLLNQHEMAGGITVVEAHGDQLIKDIYQRYHNRSLSVILNNDGSISQELVASVAQSIYYNHQNPDGWEKMAEIFKQPSLQLATLSITEKGYSLRDINGNLTSQTVKDITDGPDKAQTTIGSITRLLLIRYQAGKLPIAMVSTDNFFKNGKVLQEDVLTIANGWLENDFVDQGFIDYLNDREKVTFPWTMIDRITPGPSETVAKQLANEGFEDTKIEHNTAPFANTEEVHYLVIEDAFPNGRPPFEKDGVMMVSRETVNDADQMKVTACLNPLHTALAIFGCLLDYHSIYEEVQNQDILTLIKNLGYGEDLPVVKDPKVINPRKFLYEFINERLMNKNIPDMPQRIATDTSQKMAVRYGVTLQHYLDNPQTDPSELEFIPLVIAGWCRYLLGIDDYGNEFTPSKDPLLEQLQSYVKDIEIGSKQNEIHSALYPILSNTEIFNHDLYQIGIGEKIEKYFAKMIAGDGAVIKTIQETNKNNGYKIDD